MCATGGQRQEEKERFSIWLRPLDGGPYWLSRDPKAQELFVMALCVHGMTYFPCCCLAEAKLFCMSNPVRSGDGPCILATGKISVSGSYAKASQMASWKMQSMYGDD